VNYREHLHKREGQRGSFQQYQRRDEQYHVDRYLKSIQLDVPTFDGRLDYFDRSDPQIFLDWLQNIDGSSHDTYCLKLRKLALLP